MAAAAPHPVPTSVAPLRYPYGRQSIDADDLAAVAATLTGDHLTCGPAVAGFEEALAAYLGAPHAAACSSGTAALHLAYLGLGLVPGDEIITSPITFSATASAAYQAGLGVRFADVEPRTGNLDPSSVAPLIGPRTRAIVVVHLAGQPADLTALTALARAHGLFLIEDACHALGARYRGALIGAETSDAVALSFHPVKHITTGEGGAVLMRARAHHERVLRLRHHGIERDPARLSIPSPGPWYHEVVEQGFNYRLPDILCALGASQLARLPRFLAARRALAAAYRAALAAEFPDGAVAPPLDLPEREHAYHLFAVAIDFAELGVDRGRLMRGLATRGVGSQVHYIPLTAQPFHRDRLGAEPPRPRPGVDHYYQRTLSLPLYPDLTTADVRAIVAALASTLAELRP